MDLKYDEICLQYSVRHLTITKLTSQTH